MEAELNPRGWLQGSDCFNVSPYSDGKAVQYENICHFMHACFIPTRIESSTMCLNFVEEQQKCQS
eukprot:5331836-Prorocentrum_lima.AAC.1